MCIIGLTIFGAVIALAVEEIWALLRLRRRRDQFVTYWQNRSDDGEFVYVALGDSAAQGVGASQPEFSYVGQLVMKLEKRLGKSVRVVNLSVSGARIGDVIRDQLPQLQNYRPNLVTIDVGSNDLRWYEAAMFAAAVETLAAGLPTGTFIANLPPFGGGSKGQMARDASDVIAAAAQKYGLRLVDIHTVISSNASWRNYAPDFFHPNNRGYKIWADAFWEMIEPTL